MKKLTLDLDTLRVESFDTDADAGEHGTVLAHQFSGQTCESCKGTCISCPVATDPCICDPVRDLTEFEC